MPSEPRRLPRSRCVLVEHAKFGRKLVRRSQFGSLSINWSRVPDAPKRRKKTSAQSDTNPSAPLSATSPADVPGSDQGDTDGLHPDEPGRN